MKFSAVIIAVLASAVCAAPIPDLDSTSSVTGHTAGDSFSTSTGTTTGTFNKHGAETTGSSNSFAVGDSAFADAENDTTATSKDGKSIANSKGSSDAAAVGAWTQTNTKSSSTAAGEKATAGQTDSALAFGKFFGKSDSKSGSISAADDGKAITAGASTIETKGSKAGANAQSTGGAAAQEGKTVVIVEHATEADGQQTAGDAKATSIAAGAGEAKKKSATTTLFEAGKSKDAGTSKTSATGKFFQISP